MTVFGRRYGPWALVAGALEGIGAAFATALAERGLDLVLVARRPGPLTALADRLPVHTVTVAADLSTETGLATVEQATHNLEVGLVVVNAAYSPIGRLIDQDPAQTQRALTLSRGQSIGVMPICVRAAQTPENSHPLAAPVVTAACRCCWPTGTCRRWPLRAGVG